MLIVCPNCQTYYTVDRKGFEPSGRSVRCSNCGNTWRQGPVDAPPAMAVARPPVASPATAAVQAPPPPPPNPASENQAPVSDDEVVEPDFDLPDPEEVDDPDSDMAASIDAMFDEEDTADSESTDIGSDGNAPLSDEDIANLFDDDEPRAVDSIVEDATPEPEPVAVDDIDDIPEPDPIPDSLTTGFDDDTDSKPLRRKPGVTSSVKTKKKGGGGKIALVMGVIVAFSAAILAGGYLARAMIVDLVPQTKLVYDALGIETAVVGDGLEIQNVRSTRATEGGIDILVVTATIANTVSEPKSVPLVHAILLDADGVEMQTVAQEPPVTSLDGGQKIDFEVRIEEPSPLSRRLEVAFAARPGNGH